METVITVEFWDGYVGAWFRYDDARTRDEALALVDRLQDGGNLRIRFVTTTTEEIDTVAHARARRAREITEAADELGIDVSGYSHPDADTGEWMDADNAPTASVDAWKRDAQYAASPASASLVPSLAHRAHPVPADAWEGTR